MTKQEQSKEDRILKGLENIAVKMNEQYGSIIKKLDEHDSQFVQIKSEFNALREDFAGVKSGLNTVKVAVLETRKTVTESTEDIKELKASVNTAVTNHESRIRHLEEKVNV